MTDPGKGEAAVFMAFPLPSPAASTDSPKGTFIKTALVSLSESQSNRDGHEPEREICGEGEMGSDRVGIGVQNKHGW